MLNNFFNGITTFKANNIFFNIVNFVNNYTKKLEYFKIKTVYQGNFSLPSIIFINGFLQKDEFVSDWLQAVSVKFPNNTKIWVNWDSKNLKNYIR